MKKKKIQNCKKLKTFVSLQKDFEQKITSYIYIIHCTFIIQIFVKIFTKSKCNHSERKPRGIEMINFYLVQKYSIRSTKSDPRVSFHLSPLSPPPPPKSPLLQFKISTACARSLKPICTKSSAPMYNGWYHTGLHPRVALAIDFSASRRWYPCLVCCTLHALSVSVLPGCLSLEG